MSRELVKWHGGKLVPSPIAESRRAISEALALVKPSSAWSNRADVCTCGVAEIVDLPRICAVHDKPFAARYVTGDDGRYRHAQTIRVTEALYLTQYADAAQRTLVPTEAIADETCPWCGASGFGAVLCRKCRAEVCYGKTAGRFFRCRDSCGHKGSMSSEDRTHKGIVPGIVRRGWSVF
jgi:hypothetical protein